MARSYTRKGETKEEMDRLAYCSVLYSNNENNKELVYELERIAPTQKEEDILYEEVEKAVNRLKKNKCPGTDEITGEMSQAVGERMTEEIHKLRSHALGEGKIPVWTQTILVSIPKKGDLI